MLYFTNGRGRTFALWAPVENGELLGDKQNVAFLKPVLSQTAQFVVLMERLIQVSEH